jgi:hypothetical protein
MQINYLSRALTDMNSEKSCDGDGLQVDSELLEERKLFLFCPLLAANLSSMTAS